MISVSPCLFFSFFFSSIILCAVWLCLVVRSLLIINSFSTHFAYSLLFTSIFVIFILLLFFGFCRYFIELFLFWRLFRSHSPSTSGPVDTLCRTRNNEYMKLIKVMYVRSLKMIRIMLFFGRFRLLSLKLLLSKCGKWNLVDLTRV